MLYLNNLFHISKKSIAPITATTNSPIQLLTGNSNRLKSQPPKAPPITPKTRFTMQPLPSPSYNLLATNPAMIPVIIPTVIVLIYIIIIPLSRQIYKKDT